MRVCDGCELQRWRESASGAWRIPEDFTVHLWKGELLPFAVRRNAVSAFTLRLWAHTWRDGGGDSHLRLEELVEVTDSLLSFASQVQRAELLGERHRDRSVRTEWAVMAGRGWKLWRAANTHIATCMADMHERREVPVEGERLPEIARQFCDGMLAIKNLAATQGLHEELDSWVGAYCTMAECGKVISYQVLYVAAQLPTRHVVQLVDERYEEKYELVKLSRPTGWT